MKKSALLLLLSTLYSCAVFRAHRNDIKVPYTDWMNVVSGLLVAELPNVCKSWPAAWGDCKNDGILEMNYFKSVSIDNNIFVIDSLIEKSSLNKKEDYNILVVEKFSDGFNAWHCTSILIICTSKTFGVDICKSSPDRDPFLLMKEKATIEQTALERKQIKNYFKKKTGAYSSDIIAVTMLDKYYNIIKCHIALYP
jgi:hypothetical protein